MSALTAFALRHWRGAIGLAAITVLATLIAIRTGQRDEARAALERSEQTRALFAARIRARAAEAARGFTERARRTEQAQAHISQEVSRDYQKRMADLRRRVDALRVRAAADRADPGGTGAARLPGLPDAAGGSDASAGDHRLSLEQRIAATEQAIRLEALQGWIRRQQAAEQRPPDTEMSRNDAKSSPRRRSGLTAESRWRSLCCNAARGHGMDEGGARALIAEELAVSVERVVDEATFQRDLGADSLDLVELTMRFEEAFDIAITEEEAIGCATVADALKLLRGKTSLDMAA